MQKPENKNIKEMLKSDFMKAKLLVKKAESKVDQFLAMMMRVVRGYRKPRKEVHDVAMAFLLILGEYQGYTEVWNHI